MKNLDHLIGQVEAFVRSKSEDGEELASNTQRLLETAIKGPDEIEANKAWFLNQVVSSRLQFIKCFQTMQAGAFYEAWCSLEQIEIALRWLKKNPFLDLKNFGVLELAVAVSNWQSLYPYKIFLSPEFIVKKRECGICGEAVDPWSTCFHEPGLVYHGRLCHRILRDSELISVSLVTDPVQKYSVCFLSDENGHQRDQYDYSIVAYALKLVRSPFTFWKPKWSTALHAHSLFSNVGQSDGCPCESGRLYSDCCLQLRGVKRPHIDIVIDGPLPEGVSALELFGYKSHIGQQELSPTSEFAAISKQSD